MLTVAAGRLPLPNLPNFQETDYGGNKQDKVIRILSYFGPIVIVIGFIGTNKFLNGADLDPLYLILKHFPLFNDIIQYLASRLIPIDGLVIDKDHWLLVPARYFFTMAGCTLFWGLAGFTILGAGSIMGFINEILKCLIWSIGVNVHETKTYSNYKFFHEYKKLCILVNEINNLIMFSISLLMIAIGALMMTVNFTSLRFMNTLTFLYTVYFPALAILQTAVMYILLGMIAEIAHFAEEFKLVFWKRIHFKGEQRMLKSLYLFRLKLNQVNIRRRFVTEYFKNCLDNTMAFLIYSKRFNFSNY